MGEMKNSERVGGGGGREREAERGRVDSGKRKEGRGSKAIMREQDQGRQRTQVE